MKNTLAILLLSGLLFTACGGSTIKPADKILDNSIFTEATDSGSISRCNDILDKELKTSCEKVIDDRNATNVAIADMDKSKCNKVSDERYKKECETQVDAAVKAKNDEEKRLEIGKKASDTGDFTICNQISDEDQAASCRYNILANQAMQQKNQSLCDNIGKKEFVDQCKKNISN